LSISEVVELEDDELLPPPPPPPPPPVRLLEAAEDVFVGLVEDEVLLEVVLLSELDAVVLVLVEVDVVVPSAAVVTEEVDCICMVPGFHSKMP
jgi:hypothetical protein